VYKQHDRRWAGAGRSVQVEVLFGRRVRPVGDVVLDALRAQPGESTEREQREAEAADPTYWTALKAFTNPFP
jgi:hypothetical protein